MITILGFLPSMLTETTPHDVQFTRLWIAQEIGTATPATLFWGDAEIDWDELSHVTGILNTDFHLLRRRFSIFTPSIRYLHRRFVEPDTHWDEDYNRGNFIYELHRARHMRTKDPRDHVYAFLGHFSITKGGAALAAMRPDYGLSLAAVYTDVAVRALSGATSLILLSAVHNVASADRTQHLRLPLQLPSWVPDWRVLPLHLLGSPETPHRAAGTTKPNLRIDEAAGVLHIVGRRIDMVARHWWTFYGRAFDMRSGGGPGAGRALPLENLWRDVSGLREYNLEARYVNGTESTFFALVQTLSNACIGMDRSPAYETVPKEEWLANGAAYLVRAKSSTHPQAGEGNGVEGDQDQSSTIISPELRELARKGDAFKWSHQATLVSRYRRFAVTSKGYFLLGPDILEDNDVVVLLHGGRTPFLLRPRPWGDGWTFLGECYVHGLMNGEGMEHGVDEVFSIK